MTHDPIKTEEAPDPAVPAGRLSETPPPNFIWLDTRYLAFGLLWGLPISKSEGRTS
jgi:hypothetical protein